LALPKSLCHLPLVLWLVSYLESTACAEWPNGSPLTSGHDCSLAIL